jgi:hypothetical protein
MATSMQRFLVKQRFWLRLGLKSATGILTGMQAEQAEQCGL